MRSAKQETIADIVREMRTIGRLDEKSTDKIPRTLQALGLRTYADRIEAAAKREREAGAAAAQICGEVGEMVWREAARMSDERTAEKYSAVGNAAAMREALEKVRFYLPYFLQYVSLHREDAAAGGYYERIQEIVTAALSSPPRNCDRFATLDDARNAFFADYVPDETCSSANAFAIWLFDEAKGETDGSK